MKKYYYILFLLTLFAYSNTFSVPFHFDDYPSIIENKTIQSLNPFEIFSFQGSRFFLMYSFAINYALDGFHSVGFHIFNFIIHFLNGILLLSLLKLIISNLNKSYSYNGPTNFLIFFTVGIFLLHPVQSQAITYIWQRAASLVVLFYLLSLFAYLKAILHNSKSLLFIAFLSSFLAMFTKENSITIPFTSLLIAYWIFDKKIFIKKAIPFSIPLFLTMSFSIINFLLGNNLQQEHVENFSVPGLNHYTFILTQFANTFKYIEILFIPDSICVIQEVPLRKSFFELAVFGGFLLITSLIGLAFFFRKKLPLFSLGIFFFFISIALEAGLVQIPDFFFDHRLYLPFIGLSLIIFEILNYISNIIIKSSSKIIIKASPFVLLIILFLFSLSTFNRNTVWKSELSLWNDAVIKYPSSTRANNNLANSLAREGRYVEAIKHYKKLLGNPKDREYALYQLFYSYLRTNNKKEALKYLETLRKDFPNGQFLEHAQKLLLKYNQNSS